MDISKKTMEISITSTGGKKKVLAKFKNFGMKLNIWLRQ